VLKHVLRILVICSLVVPAVIGMSSHASASNDRYTSRQWPLKRVGAEKAWATGRGKGITIAIVDSGVDLHHEDLKGAFVPGYDFVDGDSDPSDRFGHGTHVAGIAAARANNGIGIAGVAPEAKIMPVRVLDDSGSGSGGDVDAGIHWAVDHGADVVNLSLSDGVSILGLFGGSLDDALNYAWSKGVIPVIVTGNDGDGLFSGDPRGASALYVTSTGPDDVKASYANSVGGAAWGIAAPGGTDAQSKSSMVYSTIWSTNPSVHYGWGMGTSMAAPHVAGAAAVLRGLGLSPQQTVNRLLATAKDIGTPGRDSTYGAGRLDLAAAVAGLKTANAAGTPLAPSSPPTSRPSTSHEPASTEPARTSSPAAEAEPTATPAVIESPESASPRTPQVRAIGDDQDRRRSPLLPVAAAGALVGLSLALFDTVRQRRGG
jgi:subtilisin family serine protease